MHVECVDCGHHSCIRCGDKEKLPDGFDSAIVATKSKNFKSVLS